MPPKPPPLPPLPPPTPPPAFPSVYKVTANIVNSNHNCDNRLSILLASPTPCSGYRSVHGQDMDANGMYGSGTINFYGKEKPSGDYPGVCRCVMKEQACGGWSQRGANVAKVTMQVSH